MTGIIRLKNLDATCKPTSRFTQGLGIDEPLATYASGVPAYYEADGLGSITSLTDPTGAIANSYTYRLRSERQHAEQEQPERRHELRVGFREPVDQCHAAERQRAPLQG